MAPTVASVALALGMIRASRPIPLPSCRPLVTWRPESTEVPVLPDPLWRSQRRPKALGGPGWSFDSVSRRVAREFRESQFS